MTDDRETRLRQRIDQLLDERETLRARIVKLERLHKRYYERSLSAKLWRHRALRKTA